jgi:hypothetical protein
VSFLCDERTLTAGLEAEKQPRPARKQLVSGVYSNANLLRKQAVFDNNSNIPGEFNVPFTS